MRVGFVLKETGCQIGHLERKLVYSEVNFMLLKIVKDVMNFCLLYWKLKPRATAPGADTWAGGCPLRPLEGERRPRLAHRTGNDALGGAPCSGEP